MSDAPEKSSIIRMFHVHHNYGPKKALVDITLDIAKNEFVFISGPSGAGKTTLLKLFYLGEPVSPQTYSTTQTQIRRHLSGLQTYSD
jgi:cell division transport system ATP-binding protein